MPPPICINVRWRASKRSYELGEARIHARVHHPEVLVDLFRTPVDFGETCVDLGEARIHSGEARIHPPSQILDPIV